MYSILLAALVLDGIFLSVVILMQAGKGGGLAAVGGSGGTMADGVLGGRQATTVLTRATWFGWRSLHDSGTGPLDYVVSFRGS